ncbi:MAG TPA: M56 family metallopeptidase [Gemmatimonadaceae bacterium]|nr:M56 family metallopeptidase [Gemmatimonadaceae bacterium]
MVAPVPVLTPADSARAVGAVYTMSLLALLPIVAAAATAFALRRASAESRVLVWRAAIVLLISMLVVRPFTGQSTAWVVPALLASPLVALGRVQMTTLALGSHGRMDQLSNAGVVTMIQVLLAVYVTGAIVVLAPTVFAFARARRALSTAVPAGPAWEELLNDSRQRLGIRRRVRLFVSRDVGVPMTWGCLRPVVLLPHAIVDWSANERRLALIHELTHVRRDDWLVALIARVSCAAYWFHPGVWFLARRLREDCEIACDDAVLACGARQSDYASLLMRAAESLWCDSARPRTALALSHRVGLRRRLLLIVDARRAVRPLARQWRVLAATATLALVWPMSAIQLAPTRDVLTTLMRDGNWQTRAYAVLGLAQRPDSVAVARTAAEWDPNPRVRAWARYALGARGLAAPLESSPEVSPQVPIARP